MSTFHLCRKIFCVDNEGETKNLVRHMSNLTPKVLTFRQDRGYMLPSTWEYNAETRVLALGGYVRGVGFSVKHPVHITGHGDFQITKICSGSDPCPIKTGHRHGEAEMDDATTGSVGLSYTRVM